MNTSSASHLRGRYLLRNPLLFTYLSTTDALLRIVGSREQAATRHDPPRRVLLAIGGHLGDAIVASRAVQLLKTSLDGIEVGIVAPSWSRVVFETEPSVRWLHTVDHWRMNRTGKPLASRIRCYRNTWRSARASISDVGYDIAVDLYPYYPNMAGLLWRSGIARRVGFASGGRAPLYTAASEWIDDRSHISEKQLRLLRTALPELDGAAAPAPRLAPPTATATQTVGALLASNSVATGSRYVILHPGAGMATRLWPVASWRELAQRVSSVVPVVLTGVGLAEQVAAGTIAQGLDGCVNLVDQLNWRQLEALVANAAVVVAGETSVGHLAAAHRTPGVGIYTGITDTREWRPLGAPAVPMAILSAPVPCAPCYRANGCEAMTCVRDIPVNRVLTEVFRILDLESR
ncbi:MAG TPA: glycosyltransferase family 9 protein [Gemmatimonadaceae bacterium]|jgi:ADP-heptose:LPS heptosyltransferase